MEDMSFELDAIGHVESSLVEPIDGTPVIDVKSVLAGEQAHARITSDRQVSITFM
jgi:tRNA (Thr-GGU) A37 N-methylase